MKWIRCSILYFVVISLTGCLSVKPGSTKSGLKYYESFFVGEEGIQYFIKPLELSSNNGNSITLDFVFRYKDKTDSPVTVNYSILGDNVIKRVDNILISNSEINIRLTDNKFLFNEKNDEDFISRFSSTTTLDSLIRLFKDQNWSITFNTPTDTSGKIYYTNQKSEKAIASLYNNVFILF